jgi:hypothetical protein
MKEKSAYGFLIATTRSLALRDVLDDSIREQRKAAREESKR